MFNPDEFMNTEIAEEFATKRELLPPGEYQAMIEEIEAKTIGEANWPILSLRYKIVNNPEEDIAGRILFDTIFLDVDEKGSLIRGPNKNIRLGQLLAALGLNGRPWRPAMLTGQVVMLHVTIRQNKKTGDMENNVQKVAEV